MFIPDPGHPTPRRWKRLLTPSSEGEGGLAIFFLAWGWVRFALGTPVTCLRGETGVGAFFLLVRPAEGAGALAPARFFL